MSENTPQSDAGTRSDPLVFEPSETGASPAAVAAPEPEDEPPGMRACGLVLLAFQPEGRRERLLAEVSA